MMNNINILTAIWGLLTQGEFEVKLIRQIYNNVSCAKLSYYFFRSTS